MIPCRIVIGLVYGHRPELHQLLVEDLAGRKDPNPILMDIMALEGIRGHIFWRLTLTVA
jgi:hypothetical protein